VDQETSFGRAFPPHVRHNVYVLAIGSYDPITVEDVLTAFKSCQSANEVKPIQVWLVKRNSTTRTYIEEQLMMFDQVRFVPVQGCCVSHIRVSYQASLPCPHLTNNEESVQGGIQGCSFSNL
jgi:hypothetical protein